MPRSSFPSGACLAIFFGLAHLLHNVMADCPPYSPFVPVFKAKDLGYIGRSNDCWSWSIFVLETANETRKLQFAAVALVIGLVPLTLKDIAWPERRLVSVTRPLPPALDTLVRALGPVPSVAREGTRKYAFSSSKMYRWANSYSIGITASLCWHRSARAVLEAVGTGCVYPFTVLSWHVVALLPAIITRVFRNRAPPEKLDPSGMVRLEATMDDDDDAIAHSRTVNTYVYAHRGDGNIVVNDGEFTVEGRFKRGYVLIV
ncbi:hypothetical protein C8R45DRAFT_928948 [Mycena sanguinolenta]|nr:hypothetical protein C8R45DRAFT_928948 [Mycena sanguinolenta]